MDIKFTVRGQTLKVITPITLASDSVGYLNAAFDFSADWNGLDKWAHLKSGDGVTYNLELQNDRISGLNLGVGRWSVWVHGNDVTAGTPVTRITTGIVAFTVSSSGVCIDGVLPYIPLTAEEQIASNAANALREVQSLRDDMDELELASKSAGIFSEKAQLASEQAEKNAKQAWVSAGAAKDSASESKRNAELAAQNAVNAVLLALDSLEGRDLDGGGFQDRLSWLDADGGAFMDGPSETGADVDGGPFQARPPEKPEEPEAPEKPEDPEAPEEPVIPDIPPDPDELEAAVSVHNQEADAHLNMLVDGNDADTDTRQDQLSALLEHANDPNAHQNIILDGNQS